MSSDPFLYPSVTRIPSQIGPAGEAANLKENKDVVPGEFDQVLGQKLGNVDDAQFAKSPLKFSAHAAQRLQERKIRFDPSMMEKISKAIDQASQKGVDEALILTPDAALIVGVKARTVITAVDKGSMSGNVFTNIDGAVIVS